MRKPWRVTFVVAGVALVATGLLTGCATAHSAGMPVAQASSLASADCSGSPQVALSATESNVDGTYIVDDGTITVDVQASCLGGGWSVYVADTSADTSDSDPLYELSNNGKPVLSQNGSELVTLDVGASKDNKVSYTLQAFAANAAGQKDLDSLTQGGVALSVCKRGLTPTTSGPDRRSVCWCPTRRLAR